MAKTNKNIFLEEHFIFWTTFVCLPLTEVSVYLFVFHPFSPKKGKKAFNFFQFQNLDEKKFLLDWTPFQTLN
jgi:hypothetical protein